MRHPAFLAAVVAVVVAGLVGAAVLRETYLRVLDDARGRTASLAQLLEEFTVRNVQAVDFVLQGIADTVRYADLPEHDPTFERELYARLNFLAGVRALYVIGPDGFITYDTDFPKMPRVSLADRPYFRIHRDNPSIGLHIGTPLKSRSIGRWFVSVSRRIDRPDGTFGGVVVAALEPAFYDKFYTDLHLGPNDAVALFHADGTLIARAPAAVGFVGRKLAEQPLFRDWLPDSPRGTQVAQGALGTGRRIVSYRAVSGYPLVILVSSSRAAATATWWDSAYLAMFSFALVAALALTTALVLVERSRERSDARRRAIAAQKLETLGQMTGGIAHDLNNLVAAIDSGLKLAQRYAGEPDRLRTALAATREAVERGALLVERLRSFARYRAVGTTVEDVNVLLRQLEPMLSQAAGPGISLSFHLDPGLAPCRVDKAHFDASLLNLVINARDAMPDGGNIEIGSAVRTESKRSGGLPPGLYGCVQVRDTGCGMSQEVLDRLFEPFVTTKGERGTGLGLAQVYGVMRQIGGDARVFSKAGAGTTVELLFPCATDRGDDGATATPPH